MFDMRRPSPCNAPEVLPARAMLGVLAVGVGLALMPGEALAQTGNDPATPSAGTAEQAPGAKDAGTSSQPRKVPGTNLIMGGDDDDDRNCLDGGSNAYKSFGPRALDRRGINRGRPRSSRCR